MRKSHTKPLYRKVNTKTWGVYHDTGGDFRDSRHSDTSKTSMSKGVQRGLDYTPLFKFLLSQVGQLWNDVHQKVVPRLDKQEPIYWMVSLEKESAQEVVTLRESAHYSGLFVDDDGILKKVNPDINHTTQIPLCSCCTHSFNGKRYTKKYNARAANRVLFGSD